MVNHEKPNNAPQLAEGGGGPEHSLPPIYVRMGEPFALFELGRLPDLSVPRFVYKQPFSLEGVGRGYVEIVDVGSADLEELDIVTNIPERLKSYDAPYGELHFTCFSSPDSPREERAVICPLRFHEICLSLDQSKEEVASPVIAVEFGKTPYRYWAVDAFGDPSDRMWYKQNSVAYWEWYLEQSEGWTWSPAFDRDLDQLVGIRAAFYPQEELPPSIAMQTYLGQIS